MLSEQLGLGTTASDSLPSGFPPVPEHCIWEAVTIPAVVWGCQGLLCRSELGLKNKGANCSLLWSVPRSTVLLLMGDPFFAPPGWGCSGYQWQWCSQPSMGRGWHCSLLLGAAPGLSTALAALCPLWGCDTIGLAFFWRSRAVNAAGGSAFPEYCAASCPQVWQRCFSTSVCGTSPALQKRKGKSNQTYYIQGQEAGLDLPDQGRWKLR